MIPRPGLNGEPPTYTEISGFEVWRPSVHALPGFLTPALRLLLRLACILPLTALAAGGADPAWEAEVQHHLERARSFLCPGLEAPPGEPSVRLSPLGAEYDQLQDVIYLDRDFLPVALYHEYGHWLLDHYLERRAEALAYYELRRRLWGHPLAEASHALAQEREYDRRLLAQLQRRGLLDLAENLDRYMAGRQALQREVNTLLAREDRYGSRYAQFDGRGPGPSLYALVAPYHELFADSVAVMITHSWNAVLMAAGPAPTSPTRRGLAGSGRRPEVLPLRAFRRGVRLDDPAAAPRLPGDPYSAFAPVRSLIRELAETGYRARPTQLLGVLADAIVEDLTERLDSPRHYQRTVRDLNRRMLERLRARVTAQADRPGPLLANRASTHCHGAR